MVKGKFIVVEGTDGSGKGTHSTLLVDWLKSLGQSVSNFDFPQYGTPSAYLVEQYLNGQYGGLEEVGPYRASLFYAMDRFAAGPAIRMALSDGRIVVSNRFVGSNMGHQGGKIDEQGEREQYFKWNDHLEYDILGTPRPDLNVVLLMPSDQAQRFVDQKEARGYALGKKRDLHEADLSHLSRAEQTYRELCRTFPESYIPIECAPGGQVRAIEDIQAEIRDCVTKALSLTDKSHTRGGTK